MDAILSSKEIIDGFVQAHSIHFTEHVGIEKDAIYWAHTANVVVHRFYSKIDDHRLEDPSIGLLLHLLDRTFEHVDGSILAYVTGCAASSEVVARAGMESSLNVRYILSGDRLARIYAYFISFIESSDRKINLWSRETSGLSGIEAKAHSDSILTRKSYLTSVKTVIDQMFAQVSSTTHPKEMKWPNISDRFTAVGESIAYRTVYARMSSQTHNDAEDTINYLIGVISGNEELLVQGAIETVNFSRFLVNYGVSFFLKSCIKYCEEFGLIEAINHLQKGKKVVDQLVQVDAAQIGAR